MSKSKKWVLNLILYLLTILIIVGSITYYIDPYQHYRLTTPPSKYMESRMSLIQRSLSPGLIKNANYETILIGSSMAEYFSTDYINGSLDTKSIKISLSGGTPFELKNLIELASKEGKAKTIILSVDTYMYNDPIEVTRNPIPDYLYDNNILNDVKYLLNLDVLKDDTIPYLLSKFKDPKPFDWNMLYDDSKDFEFSKDATMKYYEEALSMVDSYTEDINLEDALNDALIGSERIDTMKANFQENTYNLVKNNPNLQFKLFFPPNSILFWEKAARSNSVISNVAFKKYIFDQLKSFDNVELYDFQDVTEITHNLDNYKDRSHYKPEVCNYMINSISKKDFLITDNNSIDKIRNLITQAETFTLDKLIDN